MLVKEALERLADHRPRMSNDADILALQLATMHDKLLARSAEHTHNHIPKGYIEHLLNSDLRELQKLWGKRRQLSLWNQRFEK